MPTARLRASRAPLTTLVALALWPASAFAQPATLLPDWALTGAALALLALAAVLGAYGVRHYIITMHRLFGRQRRTFEGLTVSDWPRLVVFIAAHNEEAVISQCIESLVASDYPRERLLIVPVNDRSRDRTREICDQWAARFPELVQPFHRSEGRPGKPAALMDAARRVQADVFVIFDADYLPGRGLLKQLVAPFVNPEVGVTMGRVVPYNVGANLLTRMLDMERSAGYQGDQQARQNLRTIPQYGGTVGGIRVRALQAVGGFREDVLAEDTDLTFRLLSKGWKVHYVNHAECYEEVPETWPVRVKQLMRWTKGHNQVMFGYLGKTLANPHLRLRERVEALMLLGCYLVAPATLFGWVLVLMTYFANPHWGFSLGASVLALVLYGGFGNAAAFFQMAASVRLDGHARRLRLLPLNFVGYLVSAVAISRATLNLVLDALLKRELKWDKTVRFRTTTPVVSPASAPADAHKDTPPSTPSPH